MQTSEVLLVYNIRTSLLQHQNKATATIEQSYCNGDAKSEKKRLMKQRNITCCNIRTRLLQQQNKAQCEKATSGKKKTNATKKYYMLQHQNKATAM
jgi:TfoX/Sxy family transcriptional regulator of competence genes